MPESGPDTEARASTLLVARAQSGDRVALDALLRALQEPLFRHVLGILRDADEARDVLQDVLLIICRKLGELRDPRWLRAWAYRIATREAVRRAKRDRRHLDSLADDVAVLALEQPTPDDVFNHELVAMVPSLLEAVSPSSATVLRLHYLDGLTHVEI